MNLKELKVISKTENKKAIFITSNYMGFQLDFIYNKEEHKFTYMTMRKELCLELLNYYNKGVI